MKKLWIALLLLPLILCNAAPLAIGSKVDSLVMDVWYQNKPAPFKNWLGSKTMVLFFITTATPDNQTLMQVQNIADGLKKHNVEMICVSGGLPKDINLVPMWKNLKIPVALDIKYTLFSRFGGSFERIPFCAVITEKKEFAWRGKIRMLPALIKELKSGKYNVKDAARREKFTLQLTSLIKDKKFKEAVALVAEEQKKEPANLELIAIRSNLIWRRLNDPEGALRVVDEAITANPGEFKLYDFKLRLQRKALPGRPVLPIFNMMAERFKNQPALLSKQVQQEMAQPFDQMHTGGVYLLAKTAANAAKYKSRKEEGMAKLGYARILHYCGRPDLAVAEAEKAVKLLSGKDRKLAESVLRHFTQIKNLSKIIK